MTLQQEQEQLVLQNMGLVRSCAARFLGRGADYDDLCQAGYAGLIKASCGFNPRLGYRFSSYAVPFILGEMRQLVRQTGSVHVSRAARRLAARAEELSRSITQQTGRTPSLGELAQLCGCSAEELAEVQEAARVPISLSDERFTEQPLPAALQDPFEQSLLRISLQNGIVSLEKQDRLLLYYRYMLDMTQSDTARQMGVSQSQVSRRERRLLALLRQSLSEPD